ncbi:sterol desaturase family protein [Candidatus Microthrix sp.]|uniref:sterol desaturase family protein n=1 Tax=Candidatus Neomicrothrix sp. TaxID=2719034 RepID=UPI0025C634B8|nr:sterol desaturase family protein [Candidatus Microthrix sp.]
MAAEALVLKNRPKRTFGDLDGATRDELSDPSLPADPLVPVGYETRDTVASLGMLAGNLVANAAVFGLTHRIDRWAYRHRVANLGSTRFGFTGAMMAWDFLYYWDHRWMHEVRLLWANHVSHHSSERYNLSTALRQPWSGILTHWVFLPMPLLGFTPAMTSQAGLYNLLYQYWVHTEAIDRLPAPVEAVMNTASHHRVHHGQPAVPRQELAGIFIVWDKLFGTFEPEVARVKYGLTKNIDTFNPVRIAYHEFADIARDIAQPQVFATSWVTSSAARLDAFRSPSGHRTGNRHHRRLNLEPSWPLRHHLTQPGPLLIAPSRLRTAALR